MIIFSFNSFSLDVKCVIWYVNLVLKLDVVSLHVYAYFLPSLEVVKKKTLKTFPYPCLKFSAKIGTFYWSGQLKFSVQILKRFFIDTQFPQCLCPNIYCILSLMISIIRVCFCQHKYAQFLVHLITNSLNCLSYHYALVFSLLCEAS